MEIDWVALERLWEEQRNDVRFSNLSSRLVPGEGDNPIAFVIGEAPGAEEDLKGRPFVGRAGRVQRQLMSFARLWAAPPLDNGNVEPGRAAEPNAWLTNVVKFRPPRNRKPYWVELQAARPYLRREWLAVGQPQIIIAVGGTALSAVLGRQVSILKYAGQLQMMPCLTPNPRHRTLYFWPMLHPSFGLRVPDARKLIDHDWTHLAHWMKDYARYS